MNKNNIIAISALLLGVFLSMFVLYTPMPNTEIEDEFNTTFATEYIAEISKEPHSVFDTEAHEDVRLYLKGKLEEFVGTENVYEMDYDRSLVEVYEDNDPLEYDIRNLLGVIEGENETGVLIVGHYDSRGHIGRAGELGNSYGAADDGYALAFMLEVARLYGEKDLENSIYILMTDAEETGLYGAQMAALDDDLMSKIGLVINIEARGVEGPVYMFETSTNNNKVIDFYKNAELPVTYSLATAVYTVMPNSTDFTEFLAQDKNGVNFAVLNGLYYYHTPHDNFVNINQSSIQHYGTQLLPLVEEFTMNEEYNDINYFDGDSDQIFFTLAPNILIAYNESVGNVLHIVFLLAAFAMTGYLFFKKEVTINKFGKSILIVFIAIFSSLLIGYTVARIVAFLSKVPFNLTYVRTSFGDIPSLITLLVIALGFGYLYIRKSERIYKSIVMFGVILNLLLALITGFILSGASFLFLIPGASGLILLVVNEFSKRELVKQIVFSILLALNVVIVIPIIFSLYLALTIGGLLALGIILVFYLLVIIPVFKLQYNLK